MFCFNHASATQTANSWKMLMNYKFKAQRLNRKSHRKFALSCFSVTCFKHVGLLWPISALDRKQVRGYGAKKSVVSPPDARVAALAFASDHAKVTFCVQLEDPTGTVHLTCNFMEMLLWQTEYTIIGVKSLLRCCLITSDSFDIDECDVIMQHWRHKELCDVMNEVHRALSQNATGAIQQLNRVINSTEILGKWAFTVTPRNYTITVEN